MLSPSLAFSFRSLGHALTNVGVKDALAEAEEVGRCFDKFVGRDVFDSAFEGELERGGELLGVLLGGGTNVIEFLGFDRVDGEVVGAGVFANHHTGVDLLGRIDKQGAAPFEGKKYIYLSTVNSFGGTNKFLGAAFLVAAGLVLVIMVALVVLRIVRGRDQNLYSLENMKWK